MRSITHIILASAVLVALLTATVGIAAASTTPNHHASQVANAANSNQQYMQGQLDLHGTPANSYAKPPAGNGGWTSTNAHIFNGP